MGKQQALHQGLLATVAKTTMRAPKRATNPPAMVQCAHAMKQLPVCAIVQAMRNVLQKIALKRRHTTRQHLQLSKYAADYKKRGFNRSSNIRIAGT